MEKPADTILLLLDKKGYIGKVVIDLFQKQYSKAQAVFVSGLPFATDTQNIFVVPYKRKIPLLPDALYTHIVVVYNGEQEVLDALDVLAKKADESKGKFAIVIPQALENTNTANYIQQSYKEAILVYIGDVFGDKLLPENSDIQRLFKQAKKEGAIIVKGMGLAKTYPVHLSDVASGILDILFGNGKKQTYFFFPKHPPTILSIARMLQKIDPIIRVDFVGEEEKEEKSIEREGKFLSEPYPLEKRIRDAYKVMEVSDIESLKEIADENFKKRGGGKFVFFTIYTLTIFLLLPLITTLSFSFFGYRELNLAKEALKNGDMLAGQKRGDTAYVLFKSAEDTSKALVVEANLLYLSSLGNKIQGNISTGQEASLIISSIASGIDGFLKGKVGVSSLRQAILLGQEVKTQNANLPAILSKTSSIAGIVDVMPKVLGFYDEKTYLVLFQNNMELRPGGGFIGSYGIVRLKDGKILDFTIHDVYDADGQLKGHVEPPYALRRHLPSVHWYLRDSNFDIDFRKNASSAAFFLREETGVKVDGVVAIDVSFAKILLETIGKIELPEYKETVVPSNVYQLTQKHAESNFFAGSSQKKDFLRSLFNAMRENIAEKSFKQVDLFQAVEKAIKEKHLLFAFSDSGMQDVFTVNGMSSAIWDAQDDILKGTKNGIVKDFVGISEANIGVNKANYYVSRKVSHEITLGEGGDIKEKLTIKYNNKATGSGKGSLDYKNYLRIVVPNKTKLVSVAIDGESQTVVPAVTDYNLYEKKRFSPPKGLEVSEEKEDDKSVFGVLLTVEESKEKTIAFTYELPQKFSLETGNYALWLFKQPGVDEYPYALNVYYPGAVHLLSSTHNFKTKEGELVLSTQVAEDQHIGIRFAKN